jgi:prephenate dehydrogenase
MAPFPRTVAVAGLGLMGASLARALRAADPAVRIVAVEPRADVRERALADGVADEALAGPGPALGACTLAVLCTPVAAIEALMGPVSRLLPDGAVLTDVGGAKERVVAEAARAVRPGGRFVGAHPMFGGHGGYAAAAAERWRGGTVAVCTDGDPAAVDAVAALHGALGAKVVRCAAAEHDAAVAMVSHLPYLVASALAAAVREAGPLAAALAGPGLKDMTRLASFPFDIQGEVSRRNAHLPDAARRLEIHLDRILGAIAASPKAARTALEAARAAREELFS